MDFGMNINPQSVIIEMVRYYCCCDSLAITLQASAREYLYVAMPSLYHSMVRDNKESVLHNIKDVNDHNRKSLRYNQRLHIQE